MIGFTKLFSSIITSSVWQESMPTKIVWVTLLAMADREGRVWASVPGLAHAAGVSRDECVAAIRLLSSPDPDSRTKEREGRRIEEIDGGWSVINYLKYRGMRDESERKEQNREASVRRRDRVKISQRQPASASVSQSSQNQPNAEADAEAEGDSSARARADTTPPDLTADLGQRLRAAGAAAVEEWTTLLDEGHSADAILDACRAIPPGTARWAREGRAWLQRRKEQIAANDGKAALRRRAAELEIEDAKNREAAKARLKVHLDEARELVAKANGPAVAKLRALLDDPKRHGWVTLTLAEARAEVANAAKPLPPGELSTK